MTAFRGFVLAALALCLSASQATAAQSTLEELAGIRTKVDETLKSELTRFWYPASLDKTHGGFHENRARDWSSLPDTGRSLVFQSRMTWTAAAFARYSPEHREEYSRFVLYGIEYLDHVMRDARDGGFYWALDADGKIDPNQGAEKHVYGTAFALYAASEAFDVTKGERARKVANDAFDWLEAHSHDAKDGGYFEALTRDGRPILSRDESVSTGKQTDRLGVYYGFKSMNSHIHLLEALASYSKVDDRPVVKQRLAEMLAIVRDRIAVAPGALNLYFTRDWRPTPAHDSFGHDVETAYLLVEAAEALGTPDDEATWRMARMLVDHALDWGWDDENGGFYDKGDVFAGRPYDTTKVWWTQAEGLNALLLMHTKFGKTTDRYMHAFLKQWGFIASHQLDPANGGWFGEVTRSGDLVGDGHKATPWKANYHTSRALMNVSRMLGEIQTQAK